LNNINDVIKFQKLKSKIIPSIHVNTSIIAGSAVNLNSAMKSWRYYYKTLIPLVNIRHLEEVSFHFSSLKNNINLQPLDEKIQGGWHSKWKDPRVFHYGGNNKKSKNIKALLNRIILDKKPSKMAIQAEEFIELIESSI
jgi:hypothetical protein